VIVPLLLCLNLLLKEKYSSYIGNISEYPTPFPNPTLPQNTFEFPNTHCYFDMYSQEHLKSENQAEPTTPATDGPLSSTVSAEPAMADLETTLKGYSTPNL
jgi:hypothetical protein